MREVLAQLSVEARMRLRSPATIVAVLGIFALSFLYLGDPGSSRVSITWASSEGPLQSGIYDSTYVGVVIAMLSSLFLTLIGFYLVAGSIRRDRERHVLDIIAATPIRRIAYVGGKFAAHFVYLLVVAASSLIAGLILFARFGLGPFDPVQYVLPWVLVVPGALAFTAAMAVLFDATPVLRSRAGWVMWFFTWVFVFLMLPLFLSGKLAGGTVVKESRFDPTGLVAFERILAETVPGGRIEHLSIGVVVVESPVERVPIGRIDPEEILRGRHGWTFVWTALVVVLASLIFSFRSVRPARAGPQRTEIIRSDEDSAGLRASDWNPVSSVRRPSAGGAITADARLIWSGAGWFRWPYLAGAILVMILPLEAAQGFAAFTLLLLGPIISEAASREQIHGTEALIFPSPSVPSSGTLWKIASIGVFVAVTLAPVILRSLLRGEDHAGVFLIGITGTVMLAAGLGRLTGGGKFFTALYVVAWYLAIQKVPELDLTGWFVDEPSMATATVWLAAGIAASSAAFVVERLRAR